MTGPATGAPAGGRPPFDAIAIGGEIQRRMKRTVWSTGGCASWYLDAHGNNTTLWPRTTYTFRSLLSRFDVDAYDVEAARSDERIPS